MQATLAFPGTAPVPMPTGSLEAYIQTVNRFPILTAHANAHLHLGWIRIRNRHRTVACLYAKEFGVDLIEGQAELSETLAYNTIGCFRFFQRLRSAVN